MTKITLSILTCALISTLSLQSAIVEKTDCSTLADGSPCTITETYRGGSSNTENGECIQGTCRTPSTVMIRNDTDPDTNAWRIICSIDKTRYTVESGTTEWLTVPINQEITCKPCSRFGYCNRRMSLVSIPTNNSGFSWDGEKWISLGQRIID